MDLQCLYVAPNFIGFVDSFIHVPYLPISGFWGYRRLYMYFPPDSNTKKSINNTWHLFYSIQNPGMVRILMEFHIILGCLVFNLITTPCKSYYIWYFIKIRRVYNWFVSMSSEIYKYNTYLETLKTWKNRSHNLVSKVTGCVTNFNQDCYSNVLNTAKSMSKFTMILKLCLLKIMKIISFQWNCINELLLMCRVNM